MKPAQPKLTKFLLNRARDSETSTVQFNKVFLLLFVHKK